MKNSKNIGIFDSGIGGLSIAQALIDHGVQEITYCADKAFMPYGNKTPEQIIERSKIVVESLLQRGADCIIIACHTASAYATDFLQATYPNIPIIGIIELTARYAAQKTKNKTIGLMATPATVNSKKYPTFLSTIDQNITLVEEACPQLATLIENATKTSLDTNDLLNNVTVHLKPLLQKDIDTLILGCTHYSLIKNMIQKLCGPKITIISSDELITKFFPITRKHATKFNFYVIGTLDQLNQFVDATTLLMPKLFTN